ncbi:hypothetical protein DPMN_163099 [Dreissena polymorpha]|uniref:Uncharacterized protein n=1 Tax=Dreissena polymorpha TaxID=45954 RepID=A0A9D4IR15_DREPO|nr:hypothetical protein DPMN_163099 [Dreissena polymorpha]
MASIGHYGYPSPLQRERQLQLSRKQELTRNDTLKALASDQVLKSTWDKSEQLENKRAMRMFVEEQRELEMEGSISKAQFERLQRKKQEAQEEKLAEELSRMKQEQVREEKIRQQIRINSIELRELDVKIKSAYINKERSAQIAENRP